MQRKLYRRFMDSLEESSSISQAGNNPLKAFSIGIKVSWPMVCRSVASLVDWVLQSVIVTILFICVIVT